MAKLSNKIFKAYRKPSKEQVIRGVIYGITFPLVASAVIVHFIHCMAGKAGWFELAIISATIGGLTMTSGFVNRSLGKQDSELINIGKWFLISSVFSTLFGLFSPWLPDLENIDSFGDRLVVGATAVSLAIAALSFALATVLLIPKLWKLGQSDTHK